MLKRLLLVWLCAAWPQLPAPPVNPAVADAARAVERLAALDGNGERKQAIAAEQIAVTPQFLRALNNRANKQLDAHDFTGADAWLQLALEYAGDKQDAYYLAMTLRNLSEVARQINDYDIALDYQLRGLDWARRRGDGYLIASSILNLSTIYRRLGSEDESAAAARDGLAAAETVGNPSLLSSAHTTVANQLSRVGDYRGALAHHNQALLLNREISRHDSEAINLCNIAEIYSSQGELPLAVDAFQRCIPMAEREGLKITQARFLDSLADTYFKAGNTALARREAERSLELARALNHREIIAGALSTLANIAWSDGRKLDAIATLEQSVGTLDEIKNQDILVTVLPSLGRYQVEAGQIVRGLATLERGRANPPAGGERMSLYDAATGAGRALRALGRAAEARTAFDEAIRAVEGVREEVGNTVTQAHFFADKIDPYAEMVAIEAADHAVDAAFRFAERGRTQALVGALRGGRVSPAKVMTAVERREESRLRQQLASANIAVEAAAEKGAASAALASRLEKSRTAYTEFESTLYAAHPELRGARLEVPPATPADAAAALPHAGAALLEFVVTADTTYLFVIGKGAEPKLLTLPIGAARLTTLVKELDDRISSRAPDYRAPARELYRLLIEPARPLIDRSTTLAVVPDGPLWRLPFAALESAAGTPLIERFALFEVPSVTVLREVQARHRRRPLRTILAVGNPPGAGLTSVDAGFGALVDLYGASNARLLTGAAASEAAFKAGAGRYDIVQLASHGVLDDANPLYSYVSLARGAGEDGLLEAREMADLDLHAQLVVLSACETARGGLSGGEGLMGMTWALFLAGSPATVASGWKVDETATSQLMLALHRHLRKGESRAGALRSAALEIRGEPRYRHPFYWAAFVLSGNGF